MAHRKLARTSERMYKWFCDNGGSRWQDNEFQRYMHTEWFGIECPPITRRLYELDAANARLVIRYLNEVAGRNNLPCQVEV